MGARARLAWRQSCLAAERAGFPALGSELAMARAAEREVFANAPCGPTNTTAPISDVREPTAARAEAVQRDLAIR